MFTTIGFSESLDEAAAYAGIAAIPDQHVRVEGDVIYTPDLNNIIGVYAAMGGTVPGNPYIDTPSLRRVAFLDIFPVLAAIIAAGGDSFMLRKNNPVKLATGEGIKIYSNANPAAAEYHSVVIFLSDGIPSPAVGEMFTVRATAAITAVAGTWTNGALTFSQTLPVGRYALVGASCIAINGVAFRFVPIGYPWRPGAICSQNIGQEGEIAMTHGALGRWFEFDSQVPPTIDIFAVAACTEQTLYLDLIKLS